MASPSTVLLQVRDKRVELAFVELALEARHDRLVARHHVALGQHDRVAQVRLVRYQRAGVRKMELAAKEPGELGRVHRRIHVAAAAAELAEKLEALRGERGIPV